MKVIRTFLNLLKKWLSQECSGELKSKFSSQDVVKVPGFHKDFEIHIEVKDFTIGGC